jgi:glycyl-tRNA synthetase
MEIYKELKKYFMVTYDDAGNIGKRYRRGDAIGIPFAITIDNSTLENDEVTIRDRDSMKQIVIDVNELKSYLEENLKQF